MIAEAQRLALGPLARRNLQDHLEDLPPHLVEADIAGEDRGLISTDVLLEGDCPFWDEIGA